MWDRNKNSVLDNTTDTGETPKGKRNDTATPQNTVSDCEDSENSDTSNGNVENFNNKSRENRHSYTVSDITIPGIRGRFYQNEYGSIDLVFPREDALARIGLPRIPFRITTAIASHILTYHGAELRIYTLEQAVAFAVNVMENFDHIRRGTDVGSYIFSIENSRITVGKRTIGIVVETDEGQFLRAKTAGFENLRRLRQREQLWEEGAENSISSTDTASANVTTVTSQQGGEMPGSASNQSASLSDCEVSENSDTSNGNVENFNNESRENRHSYTVSDITIPGIRGRFYQNEYGSIDLVFPRGDALARIGLPRIPFRITTAIALHILNNHRRELRIRTREDAVAFAVSVMENFDHIRRGTEEGSYIFSIENDRERVGKRAIGIVVETNEGQFLRAKTAGLENLGQLRQREQLWEEGAKNSISSTDTASVNVSAMASQQGGEMSGSASNQSASLSDCEVSENSDTSKEIDNKN